VEAADAGGQEDGIRDDMPARSGRGARINPPNGYDRLHVELDPSELGEEERRAVQTTYLRDPAQPILSENDSPDVPLWYSINPHRGCEHGGLLLRAAVS